YKQKSKQCTHKKMKVIYRALSFLFCTLYNVTACRNLCSLITRCFLLTKIVCKTLIIHMTSYPVLFFIFLKNRLHFSTDTSGERTSRPENTAAWRVNRTREQSRYFIPIPSTFTYRVWVRHCIY